MYFFFSACVTFPSGIGRPLTRAPMALAMAVATGRSQTPPGLHNVFGLPVVGGSGSGNLPRLLGVAPVLPLAQPAGKPSHPISREAVSVDLSLEAF